MGRDYRLLLLVRLLRSFGFGFVPVLLGLRFEERGLGAGSLGIALAIAVLAAALSGLPFAALASRLGRRPVLTAIGLLMAITGLDLALATQPALLVLAGITGMLGASGSDLGPFLAIEQASLVDAVPERRRNRAFGRYSLTGGLAIAAGGLAASLGTSPARVELLFLVFAALGVAAAAISGPAACMTPRTVPMSARAPALSAGGTMDATYAWRAGTSIWEMEKRTVRRTRAMARLGLNGTSINSTLLGRWVKTIVRTRPIRSASLEATSYDPAWTTAINANEGPSNPLPAPKRM